MQRENPSNHHRKTTAIGRKKAVSRDDGFCEIAILSLSGLAVSVFMMSHGMLPGAIWLLAQ